MGWKRRGKSVRCPLRSARHDPGIDGVRLPGPGVAMPTGGHERARRQAGRLRDIDAGHRERHRGPSAHPGLGRHGGGSRAITTEIGSRDVRPVADGFASGRGRGKSTIAAGTKRTDVSHDGVRRRIQTVNQAVLIDYRACAGVHRRTFRVYRAVGVGPAVRAGGRGRHAGYLDPGRARAR